MINIKELQSYDDAKADVNRIFSNDEARKARFKLLGPLSKAHNIVVYIRGSLGRIARFRALARRIIPIDNCTR